MARSEDPAFLDAGAALHGGRLAAARREFPGAPEPFIDLSTGINPVAYPVTDLPPEAFTRLPEPEAQADLERAAAVAYGVPSADMVVAAPGTQILINLLPRLFPVRSVAVLAPTYSEHASCWRAAGAEVRHVSALEETEGSEAVVLCNPNNPDGLRHEPTRLLQLADRQAARRGLVVVDEAFADFEDAALSVAPLLPRRSLLVLRSFGKTYGLAGLRLGFLLGAADELARVRAALGPWAVSGPALAVGRMALRDCAWRDQARLRLTSDVTRLDAMLHAAGLSVVGGTLLFRLVAHPQAPALYRTLGQAGVLVRRFPERPSWLRFGLPGDAMTWTRLAEALGMSPGGTGG